MPQAPWSIVTQLLYPDDTALSLLEQDVLTPWTGNSTTSYAATLTRRARVKTFGVVTLLDGSFRATLHGARQARVRMDVLTASGTRDGTTVVPGTSTHSVAGTVCGSRTMRVRLTVSKP